MRLLVLGPGHPFRGGIARTTTEMVRALALRHEVRFFSPIRQYPRWLFPGADDRDPLACQRLDYAEPCLDPLNPVSWPVTRRRALQSAADVWLLPYWTWAWSGWWRYLLQGDLHPPVVAVVHNPIDHDAGPLRRCAARLVLDRCQGLFTHATVLAEGLRRDFPTVPVAAHPLPALASSGRPDRTVARALLRIPAGTRVALFLGLIRPYKGVDLLLEAFARLPAPQSSAWYLLISGEPWGDLGAALLRQVKQLQLQDRVRLDLRWISEQELATCLAAADLLVLPYRSGSQSAVAPQALAAGVPVLSTRVGGLAEVVRNGVNGLLVPPGSVEALTTALASLDQELLHRLATGARSTAARCSWAGYTAALDALLRQVAPSSR